MEKEILKKTKRKTVISYIIAFLLMFPGTYLVNTLFFHSIKKVAVDYTVKESKTICYITRTGEKYHDSGCQYLRLSQIEITLDDAKRRGYTACSRCSVDPTDTKFVDVIKTKYENREVDKYGLSAFLSFITCSMIGGGMVSSIENTEFKRINEMKREHYRKLFSSHSPTELALVPENITFTTANYPICGSTNASTRLYGNFTVYISRDGKSFHEIHGCSNAYNMMHNFEAIKKGYTPCKRCVDNHLYLSIPEWYRKYLEYLEIYKKYIGNM